MKVAARKREMPIVGRRITKMVVPEIKIIDTTKGRVQATVSSEAEDRDTDIIRQKGWVLDYFNAHPALISSHDYTKLTNQIGNWEDMSIKGKTLTGVARYYIGEGNPEADWGYKLAEKGFAAYSVGFLPLEWKEREPDTLSRPASWSGGFEFTKQELLEVSHVTVPANPDALQLIAKGGFLPEITQIAKGILSDKVLENLHSEENARKFIGNMEKKHMELCNCYAPDCGNMAAVYIPLCPDHLLDALCMLAAHDEVEEDMLDEGDDAADAAIAGAKRLYEIVTRSKKEKEDKEEKADSNPEDDDEEDDSKPKPKDKAKPSGDDDEEDDTPDDMPPGKPKPGKSVVICSCEVCAKGIEPRDQKDLNEGSTADGGALIEDEVLEDKSVSGATNLPLADRGKAWDGNGARSRVAKWASSDGSGDKDTIIWSKYAKAFFSKEGEGEDFGSYKLPFADVTDGELKAVPKGIFAAAASMQGARNEPDVGDKDAIKSRIAGYYAKMREEFNDDTLVAPWDKEDGKEVDEEVEVEKSLDLESKEEEVEMVEEIEKSETIDEGFDFITEDVVKAAIALVSTK